MTLTAEVTLTLGTLDLDVALDVADGETVGVVGPNGAGKTTLLRALAGLVPLGGGRVVVGPDVVDDAATTTWVPPERRAVGMVFQDHLLFPHLTAVDNVAFGLRCRGATKRQARATAAGWLDRLGLAGHHRSRPGSLSGGQSQRVALARALAIEPRLLLLDEPLSALDAATRQEVRRDLRHHLASYPGARLLVTHDPVEAMVLADRLLVLEAGRIVQAGEAAEVARRPRTPYVARLVGLNLLRGRGRGRHVELEGGGELHTAEPTPDGEVFAAVRPQSVALYRTRPDGTPRNVWPGTVAGVDVEGDRVRVAVQGDVALVAEVTPGAVRELGLDTGASVWLSVKATDVEVYRG